MIDRPGAARDVWHGAVGWISEHWLVLATGLLAAIPVIAATIRAVADRWVPVGDDGIIVTRAYDVLTAHTPLVGQFSTASGVVGGETHGLGPLQYWLLALPAHFTGPTGVVVTVGLVNGASVMGAVALANRRGGRGLMIATALAVVVMCGSLDGVTLREVWNPAAGLFPLVLLMFTAWSVACGEYRLLPVAVLVASYVAQCHLTYVLPAAGLLVVAAMGLAISARGGERGALCGWVLVAVVVGAFGWSAPLYEQATHSPGNLSLVRKAATVGRSTLGASKGWHAVVRAVGVPPWWLRGPRAGAERLQDLKRSPGIPAIASTVLLLACLVAGVGLGLRRRRVDIAAAGAIGLVLCAALAKVAASTPTDHNLFVTVGYTLWWGSIAGMFVWLVVGWSLVGLLRPPRRRAPARAPMLAYAGGLGAVAAAAGIVAANAHPDPLKPAYHPIRHVIARVTTEVPRGRTVRIESVGNWTGYGFQTAVVYALRRRGMHVIAPQLLAALGAAYEIRGRRYDDALKIVDGNEAAPPGGQVITRVPLPPGQLKAAQDIVIVTLTPVAKNRGAGPARD